MESDVASTTNTEDPYGDAKSQDSGPATAATTLAKKQNCHKEDTSVVAPVNSISMMECKVDAVNKSGASPKLQSENKITNSHSEVSSIADVGSGSVSSDGLYFFEDVVFSFDKKGRVNFGLVMETAGDEAIDEELEKGEVRVVWYAKGNDKIHPENTIGLADRTLMPGDAVRRLVPGRETQRGYCRDINMRADVKVLGTKYVIKNVNAERLVSVTEWQNDSAVCLDSWVGSIKGVETNAVLRATNGCRFEICSTDFYVFEDRNTLFNDDVFFPGNVVQGKLPPLDNIKILTPDTPLNVSKKGQLMPRKFTVESVKTDSVWVHWQCKALSDEANSQSAARQPYPCVTGEDLKRMKSLNLFESCMLQLNDRSHLVYSSCDTIMKKSDWDNEQSLKFKPILKQQMEENQKIFGKPVGCTTGATAVSSNGDVAEAFRGSGLHHHEKCKRKNIAPLDDKPMSKLKRGYFKSDKFTGTNIKDKVQDFVAKRDDESEWISTDGETEDDDDDQDADSGAKTLANVKTTEDAVSSTTTLSTCSSPSSGTSPKHLSKRQLRKKARKQLNTKILGEKKPKEFKPKVGDELITEAVLVYSTATVVWQDGTVEHNIPSTQLYPIHHLDNHEFFPGDFVVYGTEDSDVTYRDYGVIQTVDHAGRTAHVKWYKTYTTADEPKPTFKGTSEVSVYDLKDHPDFQYRPGTMVIRVANFVGEDVNCTAGQIIDNNIDGRVKVWWVDGHISMCWPQDLFEVGHYDQADMGQDSEDSWETESENIEYGADSINNSPKMSFTETQLLSNLEKARIGITRLIDLFTISPNVQNNEVMRSLLSVYKGCRYFDRLLNTTFFHEDNFMGLIERVPRVGIQTLHERAQDQKTRLFNDGIASVTGPCIKLQQQLPDDDELDSSSTVLAIKHYGPKPPHQTTQQLQLTSGQSSKDPVPKVIYNTSSTPNKCLSASNHFATYSNVHNPASPSVSIKRRCSPAAAARQPPAKKIDDVPNADSSDCDNTPAEATTNIVVPQFEISPNKNKYNVEKYQLLNSARQNIEKALERASQLKAYVGGNRTTTGMHNTSTSEDDSGNFSRNMHCDCSSASCTSSSDVINIEMNNSMCKANDNQSVSCGSIELPEDTPPELVGARLCTILNDQLAKCTDEIQKRFYKMEQINIIDGPDSDQQNLEILNGDESYVIEEDHAAVKVTEVTKLDKAAGSSAAEISLSCCNLLTASSPIPTASGLENNECFQVLSTAPKSHKFHSTIFHPTNRQQYYKAVQKEYIMLRNCLPPGVWVRSYEDRMDLLSVMIEGPKKTPYEDGVFFFDIQLGHEYPKSPPVCHYISYCSDRLNPNLYEEGKVCVSLLGTWTGTHTEIWGPKSSLLQVFVSIQGLILVPEPYYNEAGYEKQKGTQQGKENSRMYNEMVIIKMVQATTKTIVSPPEIYREEILNHMRQNGWGMYERIKGWLEISKQTHNKNDKDNEKCVKYTYPDFPLVPASRGFCLTINGLLEHFKQNLISLEIQATKTLE